MRLYWLFGATFRVFGYLGLFQPKYGYIGPKPLPNSYKSYEYLADFRTLHGRNGPILFIQIILYEIDI